MPVSRAAPCAHIELLDARMGADAARAAGRRLKKLDSIFMGRRYATTSRGQPCARVATAQLADAFREAPLLAHHHGSALDERFPHDARRGARCYLFPQSSECAVLSRAIRFSVRRAPHFVFRGAIAIARFDALTRQACYYASPCERSFLAGAQSYRASVLSAGHILMPLLITALLEWASCHRHARRKGVAQQHSRGECHHRARLLDAIVHDGADEGRHISTVMTAPLFRRRHRASMKTPLIARLSRAMRAAET